MSTGNHWPRAPGYGSGPGCSTEACKDSDWRKYDTTQLFCEPECFFVASRTPSWVMNKVPKKELWIPDKLLYNLVSSQHHIGAGIPLEKEVPFPVWGHMYKSLCKPHFPWNSEITDIPVLRIWFSRSSRIIGIGNPHNPQNILSFSEFIKQFIKSRNVRNIQKHSSPTYWF